MSPMQRLSRNFMIPPRIVLRQWRLHRLLLQAMRWALLLASITLALLIWQTGAPPVAALLIGGGGVLAGVARVWWQWATRQPPPKRPTLFVVRHRQVRAVRLMCSVEADLSRGIEVIDTLVRQLDDVHGSEVRG